MNAEQRKITVSTDILGYFANPTEVQRLYESVGFNCDIEIVAMPFQRPPINEASRGSNIDFDLGGVHGQLGPITRPKSRIDAIKVMMADLLLPKVLGIKELLPVIPIGLRLDMIGSFQMNDPYFNVHNSIVASEYPSFLTYAQFARYSHLTIENGGETNDILKTVELIKQFHEGGAPSTTGTFDLVHAIVAIKGGNFNYVDVSKAWSKVLSEITGDFRHLHLPIGINDDSLPIADMLRERKMLTDLGQVIQGLNIKITLENQHNLLIGADPKKEITRLVNIRESMNELGFGF